MNIKLFWLNILFVNYCLSDFKIDIPLNNLECYSHEVYFIDNSKKGLTNE